MENQSQHENWEYGLLLTIGVIVVAVGTDATGRLMHFLYGEWQYLSIGLVVLAFLLISVYVHSEFRSTQWRFHKDIEKKIACFETTLSNTSYDYRRVREEIEFLRRAIQNHWEDTSKSIKKIEENIKKSAQVIVPVPQAAQIQVEQNVHDAIQDVVGGEI